MANTLSKELRNQLAKVTLAARERAYQAARAAIENLAVHEKDYRRHMTESERQLRNRLRAKARALGDARDERTGAQAIEHLAEQAAYEHWHRLLFTRCLVENDLLYSDESFGSVPVTVQECDELAADAGAKDGLELACRFASRTLPGVFRQDDPVLELRFAPNDETALRTLLGSLPLDVFRSDDGLGWTYQFWQAERKDEVNASGKKIGADELPVVTQLFTDDYMVEFLLHNTLGAWWAGKIGPLEATTEEEARAQVGLPAKEGLVISWTYLRFIQDKHTKTWSPAAGKFTKWPREAKVVTLLDPCMGSGHFLAFAMPLMTRIRMEEEGLSAAEAVYATLRDNVFGLELDERCAQIAAFNLALTAWKLAGHQLLPSLHLACSGLSPRVAERDWIGQLGRDDRQRAGMARLYSLFRNAPVLGSLINPRAMAGDLIAAEFRQLQPLVEMAFAQENHEADVETGVTASGIAKAAEILAGEFILVATNVPFLGRAEQGEILREYCAHFHPAAKAELATCFVERCTSFLAQNATAALVTPQSWLNQPSYSSLRHRILSEMSLPLLARLGPRAFETISGERVSVCLCVIERSTPGSSAVMATVAADHLKTPQEKAQRIRCATLDKFGQVEQRQNPDSVVLFDQLAKHARLSDHAFTAQGLATSDNPTFIRKFWEFDTISPRWTPILSAPQSFCEFGGRSELLLWEDGEGAYFDHAMALRREGRLGGWKSGAEAWGKRGVIISEMGQMASSVFTGEMFDHTAHAVIPRDEELLPAIWCFVSSPEFRDVVRKVSQKLNVTNETLVKVPFEVVYWRRVASERYPTGLPKPVSSDPTQWLFNGHPAGTSQPLHVAVARLLGYRWPRQNGSSFADCSALTPDGLDADDDGIACLSPINREAPAAHRLRTLLARTLGVFDERSLLVSAGAKGSSSSTFEEWLRNEFFGQHCDLFLQRPFIWHIWDGRTDGFHALINYHKLDHSRLQKLTYSYVGDWIRQQEKDTEADVAGAADRLGAARRLQTELGRVLEGEAPYDIFVRWKPLSKQIIGWHPNLDDGVRLNIRPFLAAADVGKKGAGLLRSKPNIKWEKDRGKEPHRDKAHYPWFWCADAPGTDAKGGGEFTGHRWNDVHLTLATKKLCR